MARISMNPAISCREISLCFTNNGSRSRWRSDSWGFKPTQDKAFHTCRLSRTDARKGSLTFTQPRISVALVEDTVTCGVDVAKQTEILAFDLVQGALVKWTSVGRNSKPEPPTAVLLHGILGSRKNWGSFARRLAKEFPSWQFLLVDLRCHGDSASIKKRGRHSVASAALDVLKLVGQLRLTPRVLVGHSFGGKVALSMVEQAAKPLARPVKVWVLDATPGKVRPGGDGEDHPAELIAFLASMPKQVSSKREVVGALVQEGFSKDVAQWVVTNLRQTSPHGASMSSFSWAFDLNGIAEMYKSYEETNLWNVVDGVPQGVHVNFLRAERSLHRWALEDIRRIHAAEDFASNEGGGVEMHVLEDAGHWEESDIVSLEMNLLVNLTYMSTRGILRSMLIIQMASSRSFHLPFSDRRSQLASLTIPLLPHKTI